MDILYLSHPLRGAGPLDISRAYDNKTKMDDICVRMRETRPDALLLSPIHAFGFASIFEPQEWVLDQCLKLLEFATELWVFGDWRNSEGCRMEIEFAEQRGMRIVYADQ